MDLEFSLQVFEKNITFTENPWVPNCSMRTDGWTDMTKLIVGFCAFANALKKVKIRLAGGSSSKKGSHVCTTCWAFSIGLGTSEATELWMLLTILPATFCFLFAISFAWVSVKWVALDAREEMHRQWRFIIPHVPSPLAGAKIFEETYAKYFPRSLESLALRTNFPTD
jgi:hypothetical protein